MPTLPGSPAEPAREIPYSEVVFQLTGAQSTIAEVAALQAGILFGGISAISTEEYAAVPAAIAYGYAIVTSVTISVSLFVTVSCTILHQEGQVARALAVARQDADDDFCQRSYG